MRAAVAAVISAFAVGFAGATVIVPVITAGRSASAPKQDLAVRAQARASAKGAYTADVLRVLDGDTFEARVHLWPGLDITTKVRLRGIDAPEMKARCREERNLAEAARDALAAILGEGGLTVLRVDLDKYGGRVVADAATTRTDDVSQALLAQGLARVYSGGRRQGWCGS